VLLHIYWLTTLVMHSQWLSKGPWLDDAGFGFGAKGQFEQRRVVGKHLPSIDKDHLHDYIEEIDSPEGPASWISPRNFC
jgi:hypothetical protein